MKATIDIDGQAVIDVEWTCDHEDCKAHESHALDALDRKLEDYRRRLLNGGIGRVPNGFGIEVRGEGE